jgi:hypothetical protein
MTQQATISAPAELSAFDTGSYPVRRNLVILISVLAGFVLTVIWSAKFVDSVIGDTIANNVLGHDAKKTPISGAIAGVVFAFVSGVAGTFTACNIAVMGAVAPLVGERSGRRPRLAEVLKPIGWMAAGIIAVSATYGVIVALVGTKMPQFSTVSAGGHLSARSIQSMIVFGLIGAAFIYLGLAALGVVPNVLARVTERFPNAPMVVLGALIGGLLVGRPFALFRIMFRNTAESHNALYGGAAFVLQSLGNILIMTVLFLILVYATGGRLARWLISKPGRIALVTSSALIVVGTFTVLYWVLRPLGRLGYIWYPMIGW